MAVLSMTDLAGGGWTFGNYRQFVANPTYRQAMVNSLEVTAIVTIVSVLIAYPFAWILAEHVPVRWQRLVLLLAVYVLQMVVARV